MASILLPCAAWSSSLAPWILGLFGPGYAAQGTPVLQLLAVATMPSAVTELYLGALRAQSRTSLVALIQGVRSALMLGLTVVLTGAMGTVGAGVAVVASQTVVALSSALASGGCCTVTGVRQVTEADGSRHLVVTQTDRCDAGVRRHLAVGDAR